MKKPEANPIICKTLHTVSHNKKPCTRRVQLKNKKPDVGPINETASVDNKIDMRHLEKATPEEAELLKKTMPPPCGRLRLQKPLHEKGPIKKPEYGPIDEAPYKKQNSARSGVLWMRCIVC